MNFLVFLKRCVLSEILWSNPPPPNCILCTSSPRYKHTHNNNFEIENIFFFYFIPHFWTQLYRELFICETVITQLLSWRKTKFAPFYDSVKKHFFGPWANRRKNSVSPGKHFSIFVDAQMQSENIWNRFSLILSAMQQNKKQEIVCVSVYVSSPPPYLMMMMMQK